MECRLVEYKDKWSIDLIRKLIEKYHRQGVPHGSGNGKTSKYFAYECDGCITAVAMLHDSTPFYYVAMKFNIQSERSMFIRRITKTCPGDYLQDFIHEIALKLKNDGFEVLWTLGFEDHSNALYKNTNFEMVGYTTKNRHPVFMLKLKNVK